MYNKQIIQIESISVEELKKELISEFEKAIAILININDNEEKLLTREETAQMLKVSLVTLWDWTRKDVLPAYRIGYKVRYKKNEVLASLKQMNRFKNQLQP